MEPVTTAILSALAVGATAGVTDSAKKLVSDGYQALKGLLKGKLGAESKVVEAVEKLEEDPSSPGWQASVSKEIDKVKAELGPEINASAEALLEAIKELPLGEQHIQTATGDYIAQAQEGSTATVTVNKKD